MLVGKPLGSTLRWIAFKMFVIPPTANWRCMMMGPVLVVIDPFPRNAHKIYAGIIQRFAINSLRWAL
jgi:hypothetical protein